MNPALAPILLVLASIGFEIFCLVDLANAEEVRYLTKEWWLIVTLISIPLGGIIYLSIGRVR
jgi:hypothetical protein